METNIQHDQQHPRAMFKSYYVVWKPIESAAAEYVKSEFKSYYVVWKLFWGFFQTKYHLGLNRTM